MESILTEFRNKLPLESDFAAASENAVPETAEPAEAESREELPAGEFSESEAEEQLLSKELPEVEKPGFTTVEEPEAEPLTDGDFASPDDFLRDDYPEAPSLFEEEPAEQDDPLNDMSEDFIPEEMFYEDGENAEDEEPAAADSESPKDIFRKIKKKKPKIQSNRERELTRRLLRAFAGKSEKEKVKEMEPKEAARHYAAQLPSLRWRCTCAFAVCAFMAWLTFSADRGWLLPGQLEEKLVLCTAVLLVCQLAVILIGLDVFTAGVVSLLRGKPGPESIIAIAELASAGEAVAILISGVTERGAPCSVLPSLSIAFALLGAKWNCLSFQRTFLSLHHARRGYAITAEELPDEKGRFIIRSKRGIDGFVRRTEEPDYAESISNAAALPMILLSLILAAVLSLLSGDKGSFFHDFALLMALCAGFNWVIAIPMLFNKVSKHLLLDGSALAGWSGAADLGTSRRLIVTDSDVFPEGTVEITGIRILDKDNAQSIISATGSMLSAAGAGTAAVFAELIRRTEGELQEVEDFTVGEGGVRGTICEQEIRVGTSSYMHLCGVKIPDKIRAGDAVYTAVDGELSGIFLLRYRPIASVQRALSNLRQAKRRPIFAVRDFNIDPLLLKKSFCISTDGFEFPTVPERYRISSVSASGDSPVAAVTTQSGFNLLEDVAESGTQFYHFGRICVLATLVLLTLAVVALLPAFFKCSWNGASASRTLLFMLLQLILPVIGTALERK